MGIRGISFSLTFATALLALASSGASASRNRPQPSLLSRLQLKSCLMTLPPFGPSALAPLLWRGSSKHLIFELTMELILGNLFQRYKLVDASIIHQHVQQLLAFRAGR